MRRMWYRVQAMRDLQMPEMHSREETDRSVPQETVISAITVIRMVKTVDATIADRVAIRVEMTADLRVKEESAVSISREVIVLSALTATDLRVTVLRATEIMDSREIKDPVRARVSAEVPVRARATVVLTVHPEMVVTDATTAAVRAVSAEMLRPARDSEARLP